MEILRERGWSEPMIRAVGAHVLYMPIAAALGLAGAPAEPLPDAPAPPVPPAP